MKTTRLNVTALLISATLLLVTTPSYAFQGLTKANKGAFKAFTPMNQGTKVRAHENYIGASVGKIASDFCDGLSECDEDSTAWKVYSGVPLQDGIVMEAAYIDFGSLQGITANGDTNKVDRTAYSTAVVMTMPITDDLHVFGKGGLLWWESKEEQAGESHDHDGKELFYGVGADYRLTDNIGLRAEWEQFKDVGSDQLDNKDIDLLSVGVSMSSL